MLDAVLRPRLAPLAAVAARPLAAAGVPADAVTGGGVRRRRRGLRRGSVRIVDGRARPVAGQSRAGRSRRRRRPPRDATERGGLPRSGRGLRRVRAASSSRSRSASPGRAWPASCCSAPTTSPAPPSWPSRRWPSGGAWPSATSAPCGSWVGWPRGSRRSWSTPPSASLPGHAARIAWAFAAVVGVTAMQRIVGAVRLLG